MRWAFVYLRCWPFEKKDSIYRVADAIKTMPPGAKGRGRRAVKHVQTTTVPPRPWGRDLFNYLCLHWPSHTLRERQARGKNNKKKRANPELNILFQPMPENRPNQRAGCNVSPFEWGSGATRKSNIRREKRCVAVWRWGGMRKRQRGSDTTDDRAHPN